MSARQKLAEMNARAVALYKADGKTMSAFRGLMGRQPRRQAQPATKEMIIAAIAIARGCGIASSSHRRGQNPMARCATNFVEVLAIAVEMSGGPGTVLCSQGAGRL